MSWKTSSEQPLQPLPGGIPARSESVQAFFRSSPESNPRTYATHAHGAPTWQNVARSRHAGPRRLIWPRGDGVRGYWVSIDRPSAGWKQRDCCHTRWSVADAKKGGCGREPSNGFVTHQGEHTTTWINCLGAVYGIGRCEVV